MKLEPIKIILAVLLVSAVAVSQAAYAETELEKFKDSSRLGTFKDWSAFSLLSMKDHRVCYVVAKPEEKLPKDRDHGDVLFMVTNWYGQEVYGEPSMAVGYEFKANSEVVVEIGSAKWELFTHPKHPKFAWIESRSDEQALVNAMKRGNFMRVKATSVRGTATEYRISLLGVTAALNEISESCDSNIS